jgi:phosphoheptose isomerase
MRNTSLRSWWAGSGTSEGGMATITAVANDYGYESVFRRQVEALARAGDVLIAISTSGNSPNVLSAVHAAKERACRVIALTGGSGGRLAKEADVAITAPSSVTARIQEVHILCIHAIVESVDRHLRAEQAP